MIYGALRGYKANHGATAVGDFLWGETSKEEKRLIRKLDFFILTFSCFSFFFNHLDRQAFANAYVAGLKEELHLEGDQYNVLLSMASAGMLVGQIPHSLIIQKIRPRKWLPTMIIAWAGLTMLSAACTTFSQLCAVRFFMGFAEASTYAGSIYVMGSWYKPNELAKRTAMFTVSGQVGKMFAGAMMAAIYESMEGYAGLHGWQWVFLIDGIITCPIAVFGFFYFPDIPENTEAPYLDEKERKLALDRLPPKGHDSHNIQWRSLVKRVLGQPIFYICCVFTALSSAMQAYIVQGLMLLYMKYHQESKGYTQTQINTYPIPTHAIGIIAELSASIAVDRYNRRLSIGFTLCAIQVACSAVLLIPDLPSSGHMAALYLASTSYGIYPLLYSWSSNIVALTADDAARSVIIASMGASEGLLWTFWGIALYPAYDAPYWKTGYIAMMCVCAVLCGWLFLVRWVDRHTLRKYATISTVPLVSSLGAQQAYQSTEGKQA